MEPKQHNFTLGVAFTVLLIVGLAFFSASSFAQIPGLQGPFVPIGPAGPSTTSGGVTTTPTTFRATDTQGNPVYANAPVSATTADVAQRMRDQQNNPNNPDHCAHVEAAGFQCGPGGADITAPGDPPNPEYDGQTGNCVHTQGGPGWPNQVISIPDCWDLAQDGVSQSWPGNSVYMRCGPALSYGVQFMFDLSGSPFQAASQGPIWTPAEYGDICPNAFDPLDPPPTGPQPLDDNQLAGDSGLGTAPGTKGGFADSRGFYTGPSGGGSYDTSYGDTLIQITNLTNIYNTATGTTDGGASLPAGFSSDPDGLGLGGLGGGDGSANNSGNGGGGGDFTGTVEVTVEGGDQCADYPNSLGCAEVEGSDSGYLDGLLSGLTLGPVATQDIGEAFVPTALPGQSGGSCPSDLAIPFMGNSIDITYQPLCDTATSIRPLVLAVSALLGLYILIGFKSAST